MSDPIARLNAALEGRYAIEREGGNGRGEGSGSTRGSAHTLVGPKPGPPIIADTSMKSLATAMAIGILGLLATSNPLSAQWRIWVGGGASFPVSDYGDFADPGFMEVVGIGRSIGDSGLKIGAEVLASQNSPSASSGKLKRNGPMVVAGYDFAGPDADSSPYVFGQLGYLWNDTPGGFLGIGSGPDGGLALGAGAGYHFPLGSFRGAAEGRFMQANAVNTSFFGIVAYIGIPLGD